MIITKAIKICTFLMLWYGPLPYVNIILIHSNPIQRLNQSKTNVSEEIGYVLRKVEQYALDLAKLWDIKLICLVPLEFLDLLQRSRNSILF